MSDIEKIKAEIERRKKRWMYDDLPIAMGRYYEDRDLLAFIDSLPEEKPSKDLEEEIQGMYQAIFGTDIINRREMVYLETFDMIARHFAEWGAKWMESQMPMPEDTVIFMKGVAEGRRLEREDRNDDKLPRYYGD